MNKIMIPIIFSLLVLLSCSKPEPQNNSTKKDPPKVSETNDNRSDDYKIEVFAENLTVPWSIAVSYTHLDVYKRQPGHTAACWRIDEVAHMNKHSDKVISV